MNISTISFWFCEAFESMKKNLKNVIISVTTMIATMIIIAVGYVILVNANYIIEQKQEVNSKVMAFLELDVTDEEVKNIETRIKAIDGTTEVEFFSQKESIERASKMDEMFTFAFTEEDLASIYPPFFQIGFNSIEAEKEIVEVLNTLEGIGTTKNDKGELKKDIRVTDSAVDSIKMAQTARVLAVTAMLLIIELSVFLMMNSTKLMLYARRKEISIMKYVGAKDNFVKMPFAIEGIIIAIVAALVVMIIVSICYEPIIEMIGVRANYKFLTLSEVMESLKWILIGIGVIIGAFGSTISMNKYLDV